MNTDIIEIFQNRYKDWTPLQLLELDDKWVISAAPPGWNGTDRLYDSFFSVSKSDKSVKFYSPLVDLKEIVQRANSSVRLKKLEHSGVKGQKWGERRWQYEDGSLTPAGYIHYGYGRGDKNRKTDEKTVHPGSNNVDRYHNSDKKTIQSILNTKLDTAIHVAECASDFYQREMTIYDGKLKSPALIVGSNPDKFRTDKPGINNAKLKQVNPGFPDEEGSTCNCVKCSMTLELMNRGYTGIKAGRSNRGVYVDESKFVFKGSKSEYFNSKDDLTSKLSEYGPNASGLVTGKYSWDENSSHCLYFANDSKGRTTVYDGQDGSVVGPVSELFSGYGFSEKDLCLTRLDKCEIDWTSAGEGSVIRLYDGESKIENLLTKKTYSDYMKSDDKFGKWLDTKVDKIVSEQNLPNDIAISLLYIWSKL